MADTDIASFPPDHFANIGIARGCLEIVLDILEGPSVDDNRVHFIYERIMSARNDLLFIEVGRP